MIFRIRAIIVLYRAAAVGEKPDKQAAVSSPSEQPGDEYDDNEDLDFLC